MAEGLRLRTTHPSIPAISGQFLEVVDAIGDDAFLPRLLLALDRAVGADWCEIRELTSSGVVVIASASLSGRPAPQRLSSCASDDAPEPPPRLRVHERAAGTGAQRITICGRRANTNICLEVIRAARRARLTKADERSLDAIADLLVAMIVKHAEMQRDRFAVCDALSSLPEIHGRLVEATDLSHRQAEVCARILYGLSASSIGSDLGISEESVSTHRKRAYQRLGIGSRRELLMLYLAQWSGTGARVMRGGAPEGPVAVSFAGT